MTARAFRGKYKKESCQWVIKARNSREINFFRSCTDKRLYCIELWNVPFDGSIQSPSPQDHLHAWKIAGCNSTAFSCFSDFRHYRAFIIFCHADFSEYQCQFNLQSNDSVIDNKLFIDAIRKYYNISFYKWCRILLHIYFYKCNLL